MCIDELREMIAAVAQAVFLVSRPSRSCEDCSEDLKRRQVRCINVALIGQDTTALIMGPRRSKEGVPLNKSHARCGIFNTHEYVIMVGSPL